MTGWDLDWLQALIAQYDQEHDWDADADPGATQEMIIEVTAILAELRAAHTKCAGCTDNDARPGCHLCDACAEKKTAPAPAADETIPF